MEEIEEEENVEKGDSLNDASVLLFSCQCLMELC